MTAQPSPSMTPHQSPETLNFPPDLPPHPHTTEQISPIAMPQQHQSFSGTPQTANSPAAPIRTPSLRASPSGIREEHSSIAVPSPLTPATSPPPRRPHQNHMSVLTGAAE